MTGNESLEGLPEIIKSLMQSHQMSDILKSSGLDSPKSTSAEAAPAPALEPDIMSKLPQIMAALSASGIATPPPQSSAQPSPAPASAPTPDVGDIAAKLPQVMSMLSSMGNASHHGGDKNRKALLKALKPYMGERKSSAIDKMLELDSMAEILMLLMGGNK